MREVDLGDLGLNDREQELLQREKGSASGGASGCTRSESVLGHRNRMRAVPRDCIRRRNSKRASNVPRAGWIKRRTTCAGGPAASILRPPWSDIARESGTNRD